MILRHWIAADRSLTIGVELLVGSCAEQMLEFLGDRIGLSLDY